MQAMKTYLGLISAATFVCVWVLGGVSQTSDARPGTCGAGQICFENRQTQAGIDFVLNNSSVADKH
ncbi:hypothetical protein MYX78_05535, partial [Acidobacteria bacterium AH-259-G07]|nr:hypothetical protein [Acidobacteria bacterium AH-259-G07]